MSLTAPIEAFVSLAKCICVIDQMHSFEQVCLLMKSVSADLFTSTGLGGQSQEENERNQVYLGPIKIDVTYIFFDFEGVIHHFCKN